MAKNIDVQGHINRYRDTDPVQIKELADGLILLIDELHIENIAKLERQLAILKGEIPADEATEEVAPAEATPKRTRKKKGAIEDVEFEQQ